MHVDVYKNGILEGTYVFGDIETAKGMFPSPTYTLSYKEEIDLEKLKQQKKDELSKACEESIVTGFYSDITGESILYGFDLVDQQNWTTQYETVKLAEEGNPQVLGYFKAMGYPDGMVGIKGKGEKAEYKFITYERYKYFWLQGQRHITENRILKYYPLLTLLNSATTKEEIENIQWR